MNVKCKYISRDTNKLVSEMIRNETLLKYIYNLGDRHPLDEDLPPVSPRLIRKNNFVFTMFNETVLKEKQVSLFFNPMLNSFMSDTLSTVKYNLDIVLPYRNWVIETDDGFELRAWEIAHQIIVSLDNRRITGIGDVEVLGTSAAYLSNKYAVLNMTIAVTHSAVKSPGNQR